MGFFTGLDAEAYDRSYSDRQLVGRMAAYFRPHGRRLAGIVSGLLWVAAAGAATPIVVAYGVDLMSSQGSPGMITLLGTLVLILGVLVWAGNWFGRRLTTRTVNDVMLALREDAFNAAAEHDLSFYDEFTSGRVVSRITSDTQDFSQVVVLVTNLSSQIVESAILLLVLARIELRMIPWLLAVMPLVFLFSYGFRHLARNRHPPGYARDGQCQRRHQRGRHRDRRGQELPPGSHHLWGVRPGQLGLLSHQRAPRLCAVLGFPHPQRPCRHRHRHPSLRLLFCWYHRADSRN